MAFAKSGLDGGIFQQHLPRHFCSGWLFSIWHFLLSSTSAQHQLDVPGRTSNKYAAFANALTLAVTV
jgi:hypothetical protein